MIVSNNISEAEKKAINIDANSYYGNIDFGNGNKIEGNALFFENYFAKEKIVINQGGTDSGKTYSLIQLMFVLAILTTPPGNDPIITIVGDTIPNLKKGAYQVAKNIYNSCPFLKQYVNGDWNETDRKIYFKNGWIMEFTSFEDEQSARGARRQYLFVNEANKMDWNVFWQLAKRTKIRTFIDYNPSAPFFAHDNLIGTTPETNDLFATVKLIISDHRFNRFLTEQEHAETENIKDRQRWLVYARGITGNLSGLIYTNWRQIPNHEFPENFSKMFWGIDLGFTIDPTGIVRMVRDKNIIYADETNYETGANEKFIANNMRSNGYKSNQKAYSDHKPTVLAGLRRSPHNIDVFNALKDVSAGISKVQEFEIHYTARSVNIDYERKRYMWVNDPISGKPTNKPIEKPAHLMKAIQYGIYTNFFS